MKKILLLLAVLAMLVPACLGEAAYRQVGMEEAISIMESGEEYLLLDVRSETEFRLWHIPGAVNLPINSIRSSTIGEELPDRAQLILIYCRSGNRSKQAAEQLAGLGYSNIVEFGGILDWPGETVSGAE